MIERHDGQLHLHPPVLKLCREGRAPELALDRPHEIALPQEEADRGLFSLREQIGHHVLHGCFKQAASKPPPIDRVCLLVSAARPDRASSAVAGDFSASVDKASMDILDAQYGEDVLLPLPHDHEAALAVHKARKPGPVGFVCHGWTVQAITAIINPDYADMARRRIDADAPLFNP